VHNEETNPEGMEIKVCIRRLEKTARSSPHHVAQHHPTGSETPPPYAPRSSRFCSEPPSVEDDVDVWRYAIVSCMPETTTTIRNIVKCTKFSDDGLRDWVWGGVKFHHSSQAWGWVFVLKNLVYHMRHRYFKTIEPKLKCCANGKYSVWNVKSLVP